MIELFNHYIVPGLVVGSVYGLGAVGISLLFGILRFAHFAHGDLMTVGAYGAFAVVTSLAVPPLAALPAAVALAVVVALLADRWCYRPLRGRASMMSMIASFGVALMLRSAVQIVWGTRRVVYQRGIVPPLRWPGGIVVSVRHLEIVLSTAVLAVALHLFLSRTRIGRSMRAAADDPELARVVGLDTEAIIRWVWVIGAGLAAVGGVFVGMDSDIHTNLGWNLILPMFASAILGGIGKPLGAMFGGLVIGLAEELVAYPIFGAEPLVGSEYKSAVAFVIMILLLIFRPQGLFKGRVFA